MKHDWANITSLAYLSLLDIHLKEFPIPPREIRCKEAKISSFQKYAKKTGCTIKEITLGHELNDAFLLKNVRPGVNLILYDRERHGARVKHSLWHEIGHIKCGHKKHGDSEEIEAHFFAAQANAPNVLIKAIAQRGNSIDTAFLKECFGLSDESAQKKMEFLRTYNFTHTNEYDDVILQQFSDFINAKYPPKTSHFYDDYFDERDKERERW